MFSRLQTINQQLLLNKPWIWETQILPAGILAYVYNVVMLAFLFSLPDFVILSYFPLVLSGAVGLLGIGWWVIRMHHHSAYQNYAIQSTQIEKQQFIAYAFGIGLWLFPFFFCQIYQAVHAAQLIKSTWVQANIGMWLFITLHAAVLLQLSKTIGILKLLKVLIVLTLFIMVSAVFYQLDWTWYFMALIILGIRYSLKVAKLYRQDELRPRHNSMMFYVIVATHIVAPIPIYLVSVTSLTIPFGLVLLLLDPSSNPIVFSIIFSLALFLFFDIYLNRLSKFQKIYLNDLASPDQ